MNYLYTARGEAPKTEAPDGWPRAYAWPPSWWGPPGEDSSYYWPPGWPKIVAGSTTRNIIDITGDIYVGAPILVEIRLQMNDLDDEDYLRHAGLITAAVYSPAGVAKDVRLEPADEYSDFTYFHIEEYEAGKYGMKGYIWIDLDAGDVGDTLIISAGSASRYAADGGTTTGTNSGVIQAAREYGQVFGGDAAADYLQDNDQYVIAADTWNAKTEMPAPAQEKMAASRYNGGIYKMGGYGHGYSPDVDRYGIDEWVAETPMQIGRSDAASFPTEDYGVYAVGGSASGLLQRLDLYDGVVWTVKTDMPAPARNGFGACARDVANAGGWVVGGWNGAAYLVDFDEYDSATDAWSAKTNMVAPARTSHVTTSVAGRMLVASGYTGDTIQDLDWWDEGSDAWFSGDPIPAPARHSAAAFGAELTGEMFVCGGDNVGLLLDCDSFDFHGAENWTSETNMPAPARSHAAAGGTYG